ncbi:hypothetical protein [Nocardioides marmotae]|uniref:hypothetical protein n=1 Tax=Nocardioides marmotae TaxID=2663857 RepID=UPI0012B6309A|nr:hypothetical protein [Nocardioides marmotae]MBC9733922.1 hypothetical protein [Nocardioides marmotae]MTB85025.1 hypothetical protein [Nocardioides marmotae]
MTARRGPGPEQPVRWWAWFFPLVAAACAWPVVVDAMFGDLPDRTAGAWALWSVAVVAVAACGTGLLWGAARRRTAGAREPWLVVHPVFWAVSLGGLGPGLTGAVLDRTWPGGGPARTALWLGGLLVIAVAGTIVLELAARRRRRTSGRAAPWVSRRS